MREFNMHVGEEYLFDVKDMSDNMFIQWKSITNRDDFLSSLQEKTRNISHRYNKIGTVSKLTISEGLLRKIEGGKKFEMGTPTNLFGIPLVVEKGSKLTAKFEVKMWR